MSEEYQQGAASVVNDCCFNCGGEAFAWGDPVSVDPGGGGHVLPLFRPDQPKPSFWRGEKWKMEPLRGRKCLTCGNVLFFVHSHVTDKEGPAEGERHGPPEEDR